MKKDQKQPGNSIVFFDAIIQKNEKKIAENELRIAELENYFKSFESEPPNKAIQKSPLKIVK
ncbi:MAG: hypothetical protein WCJ95_22615 [Mariniphaga sp.]|jgi:hypothetical protein